MADRDFGMGLSQRGSQLVGGIRKSMEPEFEEAIGKIGGTLSRQGWSSRAIEDVISDFGQKWSTAFAGPAFEVGRQELGQEWRTGERVGSEADALKRLRESMAGSMAQLRERGKIEERLADVEWGRYSGLAESLKPGKWDWAKDLAVGVGGIYGGSKLAGIF